MNWNPTCNYVAHILMDGYYRGEDQNHHNAVSATQSIQKVVIVFRSGLGYAFYQPHNLIHLDGNE